MELREKKVSSELIYEGKIIDLYKDEVLCPNGEKTIREVVRHCEACCIIAEQDGKFILEEQYRYPQDSIILEFPAGKMEKGEDPKECAVRELEEESGYKANTMKYLGKMYPSVAYTDEIIHCFYATDLVKTQRHLDSNEAINISWHSLEELEEMIKDGRIVDGKSQSILYLYTLNFK